MRHLVLALALIAVSVSASETPDHPVAVLPGVFLPVEAVRAMLRENDDLKAENQALHKALAEKSAKPANCS